MKNNRFSNHYFPFILLLVLCSVAFSQQDNWKPTGSEPEKYQMGGNPDQKHLAKKPGYIESVDQTIQGFGAYATIINPNKYLGQRIKYSAFVKAQNVKNWAGLWLRTDGKEKSGLTFDNMQNRSIKGSSDWKKYEIVLDIPDSTVKIYYGILLSGTGKIWFDGVEMETVGKNVPVTQFNPVADFVKGEYENCFNIGESHDLYYKLIKYFSLYKLGKDKAAAEYVHSLHANDDDPWQNNLVDFLKGRISDQELIKRASDEDKTREKEKRCEAYYYVGMTYLLPVKTIIKKQNTTKALHYLEKCVETDQKNFIEYQIAQAEIKKTKK